MIVIVALLCAIAIEQVVAAPRRHRFNPGDEADAFSLQLLGGGTFDYAPQSVPGAPIVVHAFNALNIWHEYQYVVSNSSIDEFLQSNLVAQHVLVALNKTQRPNVRDVRDAFLARMDALNLSPQQRKKLARHVFFAADDVASMPSSSSFAALLDDWNSSAPIFNSFVTRNGVQKPFRTGARLDARAFWLIGGEGLIGNAPIELVYLGQGCNASSAPPTTNFTNRAVLVEFNANCDAFEQVSVAVQLGAIGVVGYAPNGGALQQMNCADDNECNVNLYGNVFGMTVESDDGEALKKLLLSLYNEDDAEPREAGVEFLCSDAPIEFERVTKLPLIDSSRARCRAIDAMATTTTTAAFVTIQLDDVLTPAQSFSIDGGLKQFPQSTVVWGLRESGLELYPKLKFLVWCDEYLGFQQRLQSKLDVLMAQKPLVVQTFNGEPCGNNIIVNKTFLLPPAARMTGFNRLDLEMELKCANGTLDRECPIWDRILDVALQCDGGRAQILLGRYINPFRRANGRWLTDASQWLPYFMSSTSSTKQSCVVSLQIYTINNLFWAPTLNLVFSTDASQPLKPTSIIPLWPWHGYAFNQSYASYFPAVAVDGALLQAAKKIEIVSIITGHGSDSNGCGEFCNTTHNFYFNDRLYQVVFDRAGTNFGCADEVVNGVSPNEHGTWLYGRNGWCDGQQVSPHALSVDLTAVVAGPNTLIYNATNDGHAPNPVPGSGFAMIDFVAFLSLWQ